MDMFSGDTINELIGNAYGSLTGMSAEQIRMARDGRIQLDAYGRPVMDDKMNTPVRAVGKPAGFLDPQMMVPFGAAVKDYGSRFDNTEEEIAMMKMFGA